ncbi:hypothetical protein VOI54_14315 [Tamlana sp. 2201CG12-4]|uniref:hypothetical protein n=1 Tax=Tamlana sp. 2201CG12-4 TaxID=3112582 RepID=UPI002DBE4DE9|nr:hypothetical protein [Tamlana sp. 2201CG12-4]MEC3908201.1 hypothetical protein [Tamlana sp. 2201CG12-4]
MVKKIAFLCFFYLYVLQVVATPIAENSYVNTTKKTTSVEGFDKFLKHKAYTAPSYLENNNEFSWENIEKKHVVSDSIASARGLAKGAFIVIEDSSSWVDSFTNEDIQELPVGVKHTRENIEYAIGITEAIFTRDHTELTVFARVRLPQTNSNGYPIELFFGANNVKLSHQGGIIGDANLVLLGDFHIPFNAGKWMLTLKGGFNYRTGNVKNKTFVIINCSGVKELGIQGEVEFSRELILPIETNGEVDENKTMVNETIQTENGTQTIQVPYRVKGNFNVIATDWNDLLVGVDLQPFVLAKKRNNRDYNGNFQFAVNQAVLDFSDLRNDPSVAFPSYYHENGLLLPNERSWRGVYVNTVEVKLPKEFKTSETISQGDKRVAFGAHHLIVDNYGVSGTFYADNVFPLNKGRTNSSKAWAYSLDHIEVSLAANNFIAAGFEGRILLPVSKNKKSTNSSPDRVGLRYLGLISPEEYLLNVSNDSIIDFNLWKAKGQLLPNSSIEFAVKEGQFRPKATLHGRLAISSNQVYSIENEGNQVVTGNINGDGVPEKKLIEFKGIVFQNLVLQTESPVFSVDYMGYKDEVSLAGFPVTISNIGITANKYNANLYFDLEINLMGENNGFAAKTSLGIIGSFEEEDHRQKWKFDKIEIDAIAINADLGGFEIKGNLLIMHDDPEYGDGFSANLQVDFKSLGIQATAKGVFGKTSFRYWQFEAMVDGLSIGTGLINISGFAGGASYRMKRKDFSSSFSPTGIGYTPDASLGLGLKAMVMFNMVKDEVIKGSAGFEIAFNRNGGIDNMGFYGQATFLGVKIPGMEKISDLMNKVKENVDVAEKFLSKPEEDQSWVGKNLLDKAKNNFPQVPSEQMSISAKVGITYDFQNDVLHGELDAYINVPGGFVQGRGSGGRAGWAVLHFAPEDWYIYVGTPEDRLGLRIGVGPVSIESGGYFMVGSVLPGSPPPPPEVAQILGIDAQVLDYMRDENALESGSGFAFGTDVAIDTGDLRFLIFYARFQAGAGFDIMLRDYGEAQCSNTGDQVGINGWYANGQAYAYLQGELGIRIKLFFIKKKIPIIKGGAAVLLQAKAPNPIWMRGYVGGNFNILGGLVKGKFRFKLTIGEACEFENGTPLGVLKIITDVSPDDGINNIDVFVLPQATFSMKVGEPLVIPEDDGDKTYRIELERFAVLHNGQEIPGTLEWSTYKDRANFVSTDILPPNEEITVQVEISFKEKINGIFQTIMVDGQPAKELEERTFTTGGAPDYIPLHNITYAYPVIDQKYFFEDEYSQGYIQLKRGQDYLFDNADWESSITFTKDNEVSSSDIAFNYNTADNMLNYNLPDISQSSQYHMAIVSRLKGDDSSSNGNESTSKKLDIGDQTGGDNTATIETYQAESLSKDGEIERLAYDFRTSEYKTFKRKINSLNTNDYGWGVIYSDVIYLINRVNSHEPFDIAELLGSEYTNNIPLVSVEATLDDSYFTADMNPPLYSQYPMMGGQYVFEHRDGTILGTPPKYALPILSNYINSLEYQVNENMLRTIFPFRYNLGLAYKEDWVDIQSQIVNDQVDGLIPSGSSVLNFLDENYLFMRYGFYKTTLRYKLPGGIAGTTATYKFKNPNDFRD